MAVKPNNNLAELLLNFAKTGFKVKNFL